jgi:hypothetical protein
VLREEDTLLEEQVTNLSKSIQGFQTKITDLEAQRIPSTPPEEREQHENMATISIENINAMEV